MDVNNIKIPNIGQNPLEYVLENSLIKDNGLWCEFGVFKGKTINYISKFALNGQKIFGFDTFTGLPDKWELSADKVYDVGEYSNDGKLPIVNSNVELRAGLFSETLPNFLNEFARSEIITFIHIDCDIYESTKDVFDCLGERLIEGSVIVFDEFVNYPNYRDHEFKAFYEWVEQNNVDFEYIGMNGEIISNPEKVYDKESQSVAVKILA